MNSKKAGVVSRLELVPHSARHASKPIHTQRYTRALEALHDYRAATGLPLDEADLQNHSLSVICALATRPRTDSSVDIILCTISNTSGREV